MKVISSERIIEHIREENPWWKPPHEIPITFAEMTPRPYIQMFYKLIQDHAIRRAVVLMGPRRVGKTVMMHHSIQKLMEEGVPPTKIFYLSVDHPLYHDMALDQFLKIFAEAAPVNLAKDTCYAFFDEIQYMRDWERYLKAIVDRYPNLKCVVSGSAAAALRLKSTESGAGRFTDFLLPPLSFYEYWQLTKQESLPVQKIGGGGHFIQPTKIDYAHFNEQFVRYLNFGGYPEMSLSPTLQQDPERYVRSDIIDKVLLRDLPSLYGVSDVHELNGLFTQLAHNTGNEVRLEDLASKSGISKTTIRRYIEYLEAAFLIRIVHRVDRNGKRYKRANFFKVYLTNPSLYAGLFTPVSKDDTHELGPLVETAVFSQYLHDASQRIHYARWDKGEVDFVFLDREFSVTDATEIKWSDRFVDRPGDLKSLIQFCHEKNLSNALITTATKFAVFTYQNIQLQFIPAALHCYMIGFGIIEAKKAGNVELGFLEVPDSA